MSYRSTRSDRLGAEAWLAMPVLAWSAAIAMIGVVVGYMQGVREGYSPLGALGIGIAGGIAGGVFVGGVTFLVRQAGSAAIVKLFGAGTGGCPSPSEFSQQDALIARGDLAGAARGYDALMAQSPTDASVRIRAADLHARHMGDAPRARDLFLQARLLKTCSPREDLYISNRLVDLYLGPLSDTPGAIAELRRLAERHAGTQIAAASTAALMQLRNAPPLNAPNP